jgi:hypothetical protein
MNIEIAKHERMSETGSSLIRLIQNNEMPVLDLLVREAVQNSLDAALSGEGYVQVDFSIRNFYRESLARHFDGIQERLAELYPEQQYRLLEIRDSNTQGLTGPLHDRDCHAGEFGNLIKLVYQIGMPQQREGSGGSWGLGKTVYFRLGIGLVIYYSRILENGKYVSRLAACLVEDEKKEDALLKDKGHHRGIAWWGQKVAGDSTMPITDEAEIQSILESVGTKPYFGNETGTTIIIPFLRDDLRPRIDFSEDEERSESRDPWWNHSDSDYISVALQRWYAPRLMNPDYPYGRWLRATVNGKGITKESFLPVFKTFQHLYNEAIRFSTSEQEVKQEDNIISSKIQCLPIKLRSTFVNSSIAGWVSFVKLSGNDLMMGPPHNQPSPWVQVFGRDKKIESNPALISFTRKPGMIVGFEYTGKWVDGIPRTSPNEFVIGLFVANSKNPLLEKNPKNPEKEYLLEEYIRGCEKADHTSWADWVPSKKNPLIIDRIQKNLVKLITKSYLDKPIQQTVAKNIALGKLLADVLLPPEGFGSISSVQSFNQPKGKTGSVTGKNPRFVYLAPPVYEQELIRIDFELYSGKLNESFEVKLKVISESGDIDADAWEGDQGIGTMFPVGIHRFTIDSIVSSKGNCIDTVGQVIIDQTNQEVVYKDMCVCLSKSTKFKQSSGIKFQNSSGKTLKGSFWITSDDKNIRVAFYVDTPTGGTNS